MKFTKMHGLGNDYIYVNCFEEPLTDVDLPELSRRISDRNFGIGGDGLILIMPSSVADFRMRVFNNDGLEAWNCGNGLRCVSKYVYDHKLTDKTSFTIETMHRVVNPVVTIGEDGLVKQITIDMGEPQLLRKDIPMLGEPDEQALDDTLIVDDQQFSMTAVSMGNPHTVLFLDDVRDEDVLHYGPKIEFHEVFPQRVNVEFIKVLNRDEILFRVWERGSGVTLACGTGACAAAVAAILRDQTNRGVTVHLKGGDLFIEWREEDNRVYMTGPATEVFTGVYNGEIPFIK